MLACCESYISKKTHYWHFGCITVGHPELNHPLQYVFYSQPHLLYCKYLKLKMFIRVLLYLFRANKTHKMEIDIQRKICVYILKHKLPFKMLPKCIVISLMKIRISFVKSYVKHTWTQ